MWQQFSVGVVRRLAYMLTATMLASSLTLGAGSEPAQAAYEPGYNSEIDYAPSFSSSLFKSASNGSGGYIGVIPASDNTFTVESWFKVRARQAGDDTFPALVTQNQDVGGCTASRFFLSLHWDAGSSRYQLHAAQNTCGLFHAIGQIPVDEWVHVAYVSNANSYSVYINGALVTTVSQSMAYVNSDRAPFTVGAAWTPGNNNIFHPFPGQIDQVKVWSEPLSQSAIKSSMHSVLNDGQSGLVHAYTFNAASDTAYDYSGTYPLTALGTVTHYDVKSTTSIGSDRVVQFPRSYLPGVGGWTQPSNISAIRVLAVAGGGAGGARHGGGGAAGAVAAASNASLPGTVTIKVGQGGFGAPYHNTAGGCTSPAVNAGQETQVGSMVLQGGGSGYSGCSGAFQASGANTGGSSVYGASPGTVISSTGTSGYSIYAGYEGGWGKSGGNDAGGGGGGATGNGGSSFWNGDAGGPGGSGHVSDISGSSKCYGAGGGGGIYAGASPGAGAAGPCGGYTSTAGAGSKGDVAAANASANSGSGGGGSGFSNVANGQSGNGGSGVVIIRYTLVSTLTFVSYGSSVGSITVTTGDNASKPQDPTTTSESIFLGWTTTNGNASTLVSWPYAVSSNQTLYGLWAANLGLNSEIDYSATLGSGSYFSTSASVIPAGDNAAYSVEAWVKPTNLPLTQWSTVVAQGQDNSSSANRFYLGFYRLDASTVNLAVGRSATAILMLEIPDPEDKWTHLAVTVASNDTVTLLMDGVAITSSALANTGTNAGFGVGALKTGSLTFTGEMDQVKIWNRALTTSEVVTSMHALDAAGLSGLTARYDFNEGSGLVAYERVAAKNLTGSATVSRSDVKSSSTIGSRTIIAFPRTYLPGIGGWKVPAQITQVRSLVVAGGGGGGADEGGGGGAGGVYQNSTQNVSGTVSVVVGQGGAGGYGITSAVQAIRATNGQNSTLGAQTAIGGGAGGDATATTPAISNGAAGGSGGGAAGEGHGGTFGLGTAGQGFAGAAGTATYGGGGGGAGATASGRAGGAGIQSDISGTNSWYAAGGSGGGGNSTGTSRGVAANGIGGVGGGLVQNGIAPVSGTGSGGGGGQYFDIAGRGSNGASGVVYLSYLVADTPAISSQPQSRSIRPGGSATFSVAASANGTLSYQWQSSTDGVAWSNVGSNSSSHSVVNAGNIENGKQFRVVVTNTINGTVSTTSSVATLTVAGITISSGGCSLMVVDDAGVSISETVNGGCLVQFTAPGNNVLTVPANVSSIQALVVAGGGGGSAARIGTRGGAGGGGGGGASQVVTIASTTSQEISFTVGAGGAGGAGSDGGNGGNSTLNYGNNVYSMSYTLQGGRGGKLSVSWPGGGGVGGSGGTGGTYGSSGSSGGTGATDPANAIYYGPAYGNGGYKRVFAGQTYCIGSGGGGGNREFANDPMFQWGAMSVYCSGTTMRSGGIGGYHNGTSVVLATEGAANSGSGGGGGSYDRENNIARNGAAGADGWVAFYYLPATGNISLSAVAPFSFSAVTKTITLTKDNPTTNVTWTTSNAAVCTITGNSSSATVVPIAAGNCEVSVAIAAGGSYGRGSASTTFRIDKITRTAPTWINNSLSVPFGGTFDLRSNITTPGANGYRFSTSGTLGSCSVTGYTLTVGSVGDTCDVALTLNGDNIYLDVEGATQLSVTVTRVSQSAVIITTGTQMNVSDSFTVSAAGGRGNGVLSYHLVDDGGTSCAIDSTTGVITGAIAAGNCVIYARRAGSTNYDAVTSSNQIITVNKIQQFLSWASQPQPLYLAGGSYTVSAAATSDLAVSYSVSGGLCSLNGNTVTFLGSGNCVVVASQGGSPGYLAAASISQTISVGKVNQVLTFSALADQYWGTLAFTVSATVSSELALIYAEDAQTTNDACDVSAVGVVTIKNVGVCAVKVTQAGNAAFAPASTYQAFEVLANPAGAPFIGSISFGDRTLNASFFKPSYLGGGTVTAYELRAYKKSDGTLAAKNSGCVASSGVTQSCSVIGLENGIGYELKVAAITQAGLGAFSLSSSEVVPAANPEAVQNLVAIEGDGQLQISWMAPNSLGGGIFDQYRIFWRAAGGTYQPNGSPGATVGSFASTSFVIPNLQNGVSYDVKVTTVTTNNTSELQSNTAEVRQTPFTVPDAPAAVAAFDNNSTLLVAWQAPTFDGGNPIDQYVVSRDGTVICSITSANSTSCEVAKPTSGTSIISVRAGNDAGLSSASQTVFVVYNNVVPQISLPSTSTGGSDPIQVTRPTLVSSSANIQHQVNDAVALRGTDLNLVKSILVDGISASFFVNSANLITVRIPVGVKMGPVSITLVGEFGQAEFLGLIEVVQVAAPASTKVTIGSFLGYAAVYTKNLSGKRLSLRIGDKWRVVAKLPASYTYNITKVGKNKTVSVMVYLDRKLVSVKQLQVR